MTKDQAQILVDMMQKLEEISAFLTDEGLLIQSGMIDTVVAEIVGDLVEEFEPKQLTEMGAVWFE